MAVANSGSVMIVAGFELIEDDLVALLEQDLARLRTRVVELGGLPDHDRAGAEDEDFLQVVTPRHTP